MAKKKAATVAPSKQSLDDFLANWSDDEDQEGEAPVRNGQKKNLQNGDKKIQNGQQKKQNEQKKLQNGKNKVQNGQKKVLNGQKKPLNGHQVNFKF